MKTNKKSNKIFILFSAVITALIAACIAHTAIAYTNISNDKFTGFPASAAFLLIIPYALAIALTVIAGIVTNKIYKNGKNK